jgi:enoyl-CoA hydratase/carnithine racemase
MGIDYEKKGKIAVFTINRPEVLNAIDTSSYRQLSEAMIDFRDDPNLWVGILTGAGESAFCAGADMKEARTLAEKGQNVRAALPPTPWRGLELWKPLIAGINGMALGGGLEMALACDIRIASENARLGLREVAVGRLPGGGGTQRLPRAIPSCKAAEMLFTGKWIDAQEAYRIGLVNKVVPIKELMPTVNEWAETICQNAPLAVRAAKEAMIKGTGMSLEDGLRLENSLADYIVKTEDCTEGARAFAEKRPPAFKAK